MEGNHAQRRKLEDDRVLTENVAEQTNRQREQLGKFTDQMDEWGRDEDVEDGIKDWVRERSVNIVQQVILETQFPDGSGVDNRQGRDC